MALVNPTGLFDQRLLYTEEINLPVILPTTDEPHSLCVLRALESILWTIKKQNGYNNTIQMIERQNFDHQDFDFPLIFITARGSDFDRMPGGYVGVSMNVLLVTYIKIDEGTDRDLADQLERIVKDVSTAIAINPSLMGTANDTRVISTRTSGNFMFPQAFFSMNLKIEYQVNNLSQI